MIIYENGAKINGKYYTKEQFEQLLKESKQISSSGTTFRAPFIALPAWSYWIPGIGAVVITYGKEMVITVGWAVIQAGNWMYNSIVSFVSGLFASKAEKYEKAKNAKQPTDNHSSEHVTKDNRNLKREWEPFSSKDLYEDWRLKQRRYYGEDGKAQFDVDYFHQDSNNSHTFPHCHHWINGTRQEKWFPC